MSPRYDPLSPGSEARRSLYWHRALVAVVGLLASALLCWSLRANEVSQARAAFEVEATSRIARVRRELQSFQESLRSTLTLFESSVNVEPEEFRTFVAGSFGRCDALRALFWIERAPGDTDPYTIRFFDGPEASALAGGFGPHETPRVLAAFADPERGKPVATEPLTQLPSSGGMAGVHVLVGLPFFGGDGAARGFVAGLLNPERLLTALEDLPSDTDVPLELLIEDVTVDDTPVAQRRLAGRPLEAELVRHELQQVGQREWSFSCSAAPAFVAAHTTWKPWGALLLGLLVTGLLGAIVVTAASHAQVQALVKRRTREIQSTYDTLAQEAQERLLAESELRQLEHQQREIIDLVPDMIYVKDWHGRFLLANEATAEAYGTSVSTLTAARNVDFNTDVTDPDETLEEERELMRTSQSSIVPVHAFVNAQGEQRLLRTVKIPCPAFAQDGRALLCVATDITDQKHARDILQSQNRILRQLARNVTTEQVLRNLVGAAEEIVPGMRCSVLVLSPDGQQLQQCAAPSLPRFLNEAIDGLAIGPTVGSCGAAAYSGERVIVADVESHPNWIAYRELMRRAGLRACWSEPIRASDNEVLGTFAMYYAEPRSPAAWEIQLLESMASLAGISIERDRLASRA